MAPRTNRADKHTLKQIVRWLAALTAVLVLLLIGGAFVLAVPNQYGDLSYVIGVASGAFVGGVIAWRRPGNLVGWAILGNALCFSTGEFTRQYAIYGLVTRPGALPFARVLASPPYWVWFPGVMCLFVFLPLLFPNGRLPSPRWRGVLRSSVIVGIVMTGLSVVRPASDETLGIPNPLGIEALHPFFERVSFAFVVLWLGLGMLAAVSLILRFRREQGEERQQIKWVAYAMVLFVASTLVNQAFISRYGHDLGPVVLLLGFQGLWFAIGVAIFKYRLYDIDILINRTLVYGTLTAVLVLIYFSSVVMLREILAPLLGGNNQIAIVASTLAIAALFNPLRRRVQSVIDRRFYRRRYDAQRTLQQFSVRMRDETDLNQLTSDLVNVVERTLQPAHVSLWLCEPEERG